MIRLIITLAVITLSLNAHSQQKDVFDLLEYIPPQGWAKQNSPDGIQFSIEDKAKDAYSSITLFKSVPATAIAQENFKLAWVALVEELVSKTPQPEMQEPVLENGWEILTGHASFDQDGVKGVVVLVTSTGFGKMVNMVILTNTDLHKPAIDAFIESIGLVKLNSSEDLPEEKIAVVNPVSTDGFKFTTTNFDDGWTSVVQEDWVLVTKGNSNVLIHYPNKQADEYTPDMLEGLRNAWNILVANRYTITQEVSFRGISNWEPIEIAEVNAIDNNTGKQVHVMLFKKNYSNGSGLYLEFIHADKSSLEGEFGVFDNSISWQSVEKMANYNKFAISPSDLSGKWTSNYSGTLQYVNTMTGNSAGMDTHASTENFEFLQNSNYNWDLSVAAGMVGNIKFQGAKSSGRFSVPSNWEISFSDIEKKPRTFVAQFTCIKGTRVLWLDGKAFFKVP